MLDFGFFELLTIMAVAAIVIGPQDIPKVMVSLGRLVRRLSYTRYAFSQHFEEFMRTHDMTDLHNQVNFENRYTGEEDFDEAAEDETDGKNTK